jgi:hypothetical protein
MHRSDLFLLLLRLLSGLLGVAVLLFLRLGNLEILHLPVGGGGFGHFVVVVGTRSTKKSVVKDESQCGVGHKNNRNCERIGLVLLYAV